MDWAPASASAAAHDSPVSVCFAPRKQTDTGKPSSLVRGRAARRDGLRPSARATTPLFGPAVGEEFTHWEVESAFEIALLFGASLPVDDLQDLSIHSFRIFVACALMASNVPRHTIKRLLRWRGDLSLEIYARLNDSEWATHVQQTYSAQVDSTIAGRLAALGTIDLEAAALRLAG